jgi:OmpA family
LDSPCDYDGDDAGNLDLSKRGAASVKATLVNEFKIDAGRIETDGKGGTQPIDKNDTAAGKANNRRVEFIKPFLKLPAPARAERTGGLLIAARRRRCLQTKERASSAAFEEERSTTSMPARGRTLVRIRNSRSRELATGNWQPPTGFCVQRSRFNVLRVATAAL